jgi:DNA-binding transcriptional LysR family regulator
MLQTLHLRVLAAVAEHGSITSAAKELGYSQPSISHHLARLEAETGAKLTQRVGRGIRLTPEGKLLANRAVEIVGRLDAATTELATLVGLRAGSVRLAGFQSALSTIVPLAAAALERAHPAIALSVVDVHPGEALRMLRAGEVDIALVFRYSDTPAEPEGVRLHHLLDDPTYLVSRKRKDSVGRHRDSIWIGGCERCSAELISICETTAGFVPTIRYNTDDMVVMQSLVAAGMGVTTLPGLALRAHRAAGIHVTELPAFPRQLFAATYGAPPDPPATAALVEALVSVIPLA